MKSKTWLGSWKKPPNSKQQGNTIQKFNHVSFNPTSSCGESKAKPEKIPKRKSLVPTRKGNSWSQIQNVILFFLFKFFVQKRRKIRIQA